MSLHADRRRWSCLVCSLTLFLAAQALASAADSDLCYNINAALEMDLARVECRATIRLSSTWRARPDLVKMDASCRAAIFLARSLARLGQTARAREVLDQMGDASRRLALDRRWVEARKEVETFETASASAGR